MNRAEPRIIQIEKSWLQHCVANTSAATVQFRCLRASSNPGTQWFRSMYSTYKSNNANQPEKQTMVNQIKLSSWLLHEPGTATNDKTEMSCFILLPLCRLLPFLMYLLNYLMVHIGTAGTVIAVVESKQERLSVQKPENQKERSLYKPNSFFISSCTFQQPLLQ